MAASELLEVKTYHEFHLGTALTSTAWALQRSDLLLADPGGSILE
jgi:hypothetical protein